jgi:acyl carrier protein
MTDRLINLFAEELEVPASTLSDDSSPDNVEQWDSLAAMNLAAAIEDFFQVSLSTAEIMRMNTIGRARSVLRDKGIEF